MSGEVRKYRTCIRAVHLGPHQDILRTSCSRPRQLGRLDMPACKTFIENYLLLCCSEKAGEAAAQPHQSAHAGAQAHRRCCACARGSVQLHDPEAEVSSSAVGAKGPPARGCHRLSAHSLRRQGSAASPQPPGSGAAGAGRGVCRRPASGICSRPGAAGCCCFPMPTARRRCDTLGGGQRAQHSGRCRGGEHAGVPVGRCTRPVCGAPQRVCTSSSAGTRAQRLCCCICSRRREDRAGRQAEGSERRHTAPAAAEPRTSAATPPPHGGSHQSFGARRRQTCRARRRHPASC